MGTQEQRRNACMFATDLLPHLKIEKHFNKIDARFNELVVTQGIDGERDVAPTMHLFMPYRMPLCLSVLYIIKKI